MTRVCLVMGEGRLEVLVDWTIYLFDLWVGAYQVGNAGLYEPLS